MLFWGGLYLVIPSHIPRVKCSQPELRFSGSKSWYSFLQQKEWQYCHTSTFMITEASLWVCLKPWIHEVDGSRHTRNMDLLRSWSNLLFSRGFWIETLGSHWWFLSTEMSPYLSQDIKVMSNIRIDIRGSGTRGQRILLSNEGPGQEGRHLKPVGCWFAGAKWGSSGGHNWL